MQHYPMLYISTISFNVICVTYFQHYFYPGFAYYTMTKTISKNFVNINYNNLCISSIALILVECRLSSVAPYGCYMSCDPKKGKDMSQRKEAILSVYTFFYFHNCIVFRELLALETIFWHNLAQRPMAFHTDGIHFPAYLTALLFSG